MVSQRQITLLVLVCCFAAACTLIVSAAAGEPEERISKDGVREGFQLPRLFDFERFKGMFKKSYGKLEELVRGKIFLSRAFQVFLAAISYRHHKRSTYLAINHLSDRTPEELEMRQMRKIVWSDEETIIEENRPQIREPMPNVDEQQLEEAIAEIYLEHPEEPVIRDITLESHARSKRDLSVAQESDLRELNSDELIKGPKRMSSSEPEDTVESNNRNYEPAEQTSYGLGMNWRNEDDKIQVTVKLPTFSDIGNMLGAIKNSFLPSSSAKEDKSDETKVKEATKLEDKLFVDHRATNRHCYFPVRDQGDCGSCWAFATTALYEWHYCTQTQKRVAFSEQYMVDCGHMINKSAWKELDGCSGGVTPYVSKFVKQFGLELRRNYPYLAKEQECPYSMRDAASKKAGFIRMDRQELKYFPVKDIDIHLGEAPVAMIFHTTKDFDYYGGGVDGGESCRPNTHHIMLMVGHGREDGQEYWLIRNSYSASWGMDGHWKLNKKASARCFDADTAFKLTNVEVTSQKDDPTHIRFGHKTKTR